MKLLVEDIENSEMIVEEVNGVKNHFIKGIFLQSAIKNKNGRIYPTEIMEREVNRYVKESVEKNTAYGELGHPQNPQINLERVSHLIKELKREGTNWIGKAQLVNEGMGKIAIGLLQAGANLGVSSRALGSVQQKNGIMEVQGDFRLMSAADIVSNPSAPDAFVQGLMESVEWVWDNGVLVEKQLVEAKKTINVATATKDSRKINEAFLRVWNQFLGEQ